MLFKELKKVLASDIKEVTVTDSGLPVLTLHLEHKSGIEALVEKIFDSELPQLDNFPVEAIYSINGGFSVEFKATEEVMIAIHTIQAVRSLSY